MEQQPEANVTAEAPIQDTEAPAVDKIGRHPVFITPDGSFADMCSNKTSNICPKVEPFPMPHDYDTYDAYLAAAMEWKKNVEKYQERLLPPVPIGSSFKAPVMAHVPTAQEKVPMSLQNRMAAKAFSITQTPLYPENYLVLVKHVLSSEPTQTPEEFPEAGPRGQKIPFSAHFRNEASWEGHLIRQKPLPQMFATYEEYAAAMKQWHAASKVEVAVPMHPEDFESVLNIEVQKDDEESSGKKESVEVQLREYPRAMVGREERMLGTLDVLYDDFLKSKANCSFGMMFPCSSECTDCLATLRERVNFGVTTRPSTEKALAGTSKHSVYKNRLPFINQRRLTMIMLDACETTESKYMMFKYIREIFNEKMEAKEWLLVNPGYLYKCFCLFARFSPGITDVPKFYKFQNGVGFPGKNVELNGVLFTMQNVFLGMYMYSRMAMEYEKGEPGRSSFDKNAKSFRDMGESFLKSNNKVIAKLYETMEDEYIDPMMNMLFLILSSRLDKGIGSFLASFSDSIFTVLLKVAEKTPEIFREFAIRVMKSEYISLTLFKQLIDATLCHGRYLMPERVNFVRFISNLIVASTKVVKSRKLTIDANWVLVFSTQILNNLMVEKCPELVRLLVGTFECVKELDFGGHLPQLESAIFSGLAVSMEPDFRLCCLKCLKMLIPKKESIAFLKHIKGMFRLLGDCLAKERSDIRCHVVKVIREIIVWYPEVITDAINDRNRQFDSIIAAMNTRKWRINVELFKLIDKYFRYHTTVKEMVHLELFLRAIDFKYTPALENAKVVTDLRHKHIVTEFRRLVKKPNVNMLLTDVEKGKKK